MTLHARERPLFLVSAEELTSSLFSASSQPSMARLRTTINSTVRGDEVFSMKMQPLIRPVLALAIRRGIGLGRVEAGHARGVEISSVPSHNRAHGLVFRATGEVCGRWYVECVGCVDWKRRSSLNYVSWVETYAAGLDCIGQIVLPQVPRDFYAIHHHSFSSTKLHSVSRAAIRMPLYTPEQRGCRLTPHLPFRLRASK